MSKIDLGKFDTVIFRVIPVQKFKKNNEICLPKSYNAIVLQDGKILKLINGPTTVQLNKKDIPGLKTSLFSSDVDCEINVLRQDDYVITQKYNKNTLPNDREKQSDAIEAFNKLLEYSMIVKYSQNHTDIDAMRKRCLPYLKNHIKSYGEILSHQSLFDIITACVNDYLCRNYFRHFYDVNFVVKPLAQRSDEEKAFLNGLCEFIVNSFKDLGIYGKAEILPLQ